MHHYDLNSDVVSNPWHKFNSKSRSDTLHGMKLQIIRSRVKTTSVSVRCCVQLLYSFITGMSSNCSFHLISYTTTTVVHNSWSFKSSNLIHQALHCTHFEITQPFSNYSSVYFSASSKKEMMLGKQFCK